MVDVQYYVSYGCITVNQNFFDSTFKGYILFIVIIKYWLYLLCYTIHPCSSSILYVVVCAS